MLSFLSKGKWKEASSKIGMPRSLAIGLYREFKNEAIEEKDKTRMVRGYSNIALDRLSKK